MTLLYIPLILYGIMYALWSHYVLVMALKRAKEAGTLSKVALALGLPILVVGVALDVICNLIVCTLLLWEIPKEWLVTSRLQRHKTSPGYRGKVAEFICEKLLNAFDPDGCHC